MVWDRPDVVYVPSHVLPAVLRAPGVVTIHDVGGMSAAPRLRLPARVAPNALACIATGTGLGLDNLQMIRRGQHCIT